MSAARAQPLRKDPPKSKEQVAAALRSGAEDTALNVLAILRETWDDFRSSDRFFKYKALIMGAWIVLSLVGVYVAWPRTPEASNNALKARLIQTDVAGLVAYAVVNDSNSAWEKIVVKVNGGQYKGTYPSVAAGDQLPLNGKVLLAPDGDPAPPDLTITDIHLQTKSGEIRIFARPPPR
jgi:hypothetical protein